MEIKGRRAKTKRGDARFKPDGMRNSGEKEKDFRVVESGDRSRSLRRSIRKDGFARNGKACDFRLSQEKPSYARRGRIAVDDSNGGKKSERVAFKLRGRDGELRSVSREALSKGKLEKKMGHTKEKNGAKGDSGEKFSDRSVIGDEKKADLSEEKRRVIYQTRLLNKTGKKIRGHKKDSDDEVADAMKKKRKRVIRIDPYDISNKRLDDGISSEGQCFLCFMFYSSRNVFISGNNINAYIKSAYTLSSLEMLKK